MPHTVSRQTVGLDGARAVIELNMLSKTREFRVISTTRRFVNILVNSGKLFRVTGQPISLQEAIILSNHNLKCLNWEPAGETMDPGQKKEEKGSVLLCVRGTLPSYLLRRASIPNDLPRGHPQAEAAPS